MPKTTSNQYLLFDWDGNIVQTLDLWLNAERLILSNYGHHLSDYQLGESLGNFFNYFKDLGLENPQTVLDEVVAQIEQGLPDVQLYPGAKETLEELHHRGKTLALISTSHRRHIEPLLRKHRLTDLFDVVITGDDVSRHKPDPEPLLKALEALGGSPDATLMIGDSDKDVKAAQNAGTRSILFYPPRHAVYYDLATLQALGPTYTINNFSDILAITT